MIRWVVTLVTALALLIVLLFSVEDEEERRAPPSLRAVEREPRCPKPRVTDMTARPVSEDGYRVNLHVRIHAERGRIGSFLLRWGDGTHGGISVLLKSGGRQLSFVLSNHTYRKDGTYRIWLVAEAESPSCGRMKSEPATLHVRAPLTTSYPSSP
jgi:hypothetical protein